MKTLVIDSSSLISLTETGMIDVLSFLRDKASIRFIIPSEVREETIVRPLKVRKFALSALRIRRAMLDSSLSLLANTMVTREARDVQRTANNVFRLRGKPLELMQAGECACLALFSVAKAEAFVVDEKTARMFVEAPLSLRDAISDEYGERVSVDEGALDQFEKLSRGIRVIRSTELVALANEKGYFAPFKSDAREAFLASIFALRNCGCSITSDELDEYASL